MHVGIFLKETYANFCNAQEKIHMVGGSTNYFFLPLSPKNITPSSFFIFHPNSLCNSSYKILSKIIANHLKKILPRIIYENQGGSIFKS
jgi:hypothetical protein